MEYWPPDRRHARRLADPPTGSITDPDRWLRQTTDDIHQGAKQYWPIRRASKRLSGKIRGNRSRCSRSSLFSHIAVERILQPWHCKHCHSPRRRQSRRSGFHRRLSVKRSRSWVTMNRAGVSHCSPMSAGFVWLSWLQTATATKAFKTLDRLCHGLSYFASIRCQIKLLKLWCPYALPYFLPSTVKRSLQKPPAGLFRVQDEPHAAENWFSYLHFEYKNASGDSTWTFNYAGRV